MRKHLASLALGTILATSMAFAASPATVESFQKAYSAERTASAKYSAYAQKAREENLPKLAILFQALSRSEATLAADHRFILDGLNVRTETSTPSFTVGTTIENLHEALKTEVKAGGGLYLQTISNESLPMITAGVSYALTTEKQHRALLSAAIDGVEKANILSLPGSYSVCPTCGEVYSDNVTDRCSDCLTQAEKLITYK